MGSKIEVVSFEDVPDYTGLEKNSATITTRDGHTWDGHRYGTWVGRIFRDGEVESAFTKDIKNKNTKLFDKLRKDMNLFEKHVTVCIKDRDLENAVDFYIPYMVKDHCSTKPTVTDTYVDNCVNVTYSVEYEIVLTAGDGYMRYIVVPYETSGRYGWPSSFYDQIKDIEDLFEEWFEEKSHGFVEENHQKQIVFYDETGEDTLINIFSMRELLSMITSVRVIKCDREIVDSKS